MVLIDVLPLVMTGEASICASLRMTNLYKSYASSGGCKKRLF